MFSCEFCEISKNTFSYRTPTRATFEKFWRNFYHKPATDKKSFYINKNIWTDDWDFKKTRGWTYYVDLEAAIGGAL